MPEIKADPTLKQIVDAINTQRDVELIEKYIIEKFKGTDSCGSRYIPGNQFF